MLSLDPRSIIVMLVGFVIAISVHEFSHAAAARALGDTTAQRAGRLTLNPLAHLDPMGTLMIVLSSVAGIGFGWGKPVPYDPRAVRWGRFGGALVSIAGPLSNFVLAAIALAVIIYGQVPEDLGRDIGRLAGMNIGLCAFNLLPIPPLDGFGVAIGVLPRTPAIALARLGQYGPAFLLILVFSANILPIRPSLLVRLLEPVANTLERAAFFIVTGQ
jgi:Zn-dependent protease